ncbi:unnamed protein product [Sympodiomycopsis kandeliae]
MSKTASKIVSELGALPSLAGTDPTRNPLDIFRLDIAQQIAKIVGASDLDVVYQAVATGSKIADFQIPIPRLRLQGKKPNEWSDLIAQEFKPTPYTDEVIAQGAFVHFKANTKALTKVTLSTIHDLTYAGTGSEPASGEAANGEDVSKGAIKSAYGHNDSGAGKSMIVEFSSPNIAKPFHAGHLRSTIIGAFLANIYEANGWYVERWNYLGDWGKQFGLLAVGWESNGDEEKLLKDPVTHLYEVYVAVNAAAEQDPSLHDRAREYFKKMEDGDEDALKLWRKFRDLSIKKYEETYARLNIRFDHYSGESQVSKETIESALTILRNADFVERAENGALLINLQKYKLEKAIIERKDGTPLYITRDIGEAKQRWDRFVEKRGKGFDKMIYVVASQQDLHLGQFFKVLDLMGYQWAASSENRLQHINFGMVQGMSSRRGTAVFLEHILDETKDKMHDVMKQNEAKYSQVEDPWKTADVIGQSAVKIQDMSGKRINNYVFDWSRMLSFEGDTGPFLQYNHVRLCSVERKNADAGVSLPVGSSLDPTTIDTNLLSEQKARDLVFLLATWPDVVKQATKDQQPSTIVSFCFRLTRSVSSAWEVLIVKGQDEKLAHSRLWLFRCTRDVLSAALELLTLEPLQRM